LSAADKHATVYRRLASNTFGVMMLALAVLVTVETLVRKIWSVSIGGVDELAGYSIALGAPLAFAVTLLDRSHIRINLVYLFMRPRLKAWMDFLSVASIGILSIFLFGFTVKTVLETQTYQSLAQTPWATPLIYPQSLWLVAMVVFLLPALWLPVRAGVMLWRGQTQALSETFGPDTPEEELKAELEDLKRR
jgi:TRAP-type C4-dicarboxylate transport system permease small subunit